MKIYPTGTHCALAHYLAKTAEYAPAIFNLWSELGKPEKTLDIVDTNHPSFAVGHEIKRAIERLQRKEIREGRVNAAFALERCPILERYRITHSVEFALDHILETFSAQNKKAQTP